MWVTLLRSHTFLHLKLSIFVSSKLINFIWVPHSGKLTIWASVFWYCCDWKTRLRWKDSLSASFSYQERIKASLSRIFVNSSIDWAVWKRLRGQMILSFIELWGVEGICGHDLCETCKILYLFGKVNIIIISSLIFTLELIIKMQMEFRVNLITSKNKGVYWGSFSWVVLWKHNKW